MIKDTMIISLIIAVIATLMNYLLKSHTEIYTKWIMYGLEKGLSVPQIESAMMFLIVFVSVILSKYIIYYTFK